MPGTAGIVPGGSEDGRYSLTSANLGFTPQLRTLCRLGAVSGRRAACNDDNALYDPECRLSWRRIMLVLSRKPGEKVITSNGITVTVAEIKGNRVQLGFQAQDEVQILRAELASWLEH